MPDWNRAFRRDHAPPPPLSDSDRQLIERCTVSPREGYKTWFDVRLGEIHLGSVRVRVGGLTECRLPSTSSGVEPDAVYCGDAATLHPTENPFALGILKLAALHALAAPEPEPAPPTAPPPLLGL